MSVAWAISDLHLERPQNRAALAAIKPRPDDWLLLAGDICENEDLFAWCLDLVVERFRHVVWTPGNHELWAHPADEGAPRGEARYRRFVELARARGVSTPEDPYPVFEGELPVCVAPTFVLYDYSFGPPGLSVAEAKAWAFEEGIVCGDEVLLSPHPHPSREAWCHARVASTEERLREASASMPLLLVNHFPLRGDLIYIPRVPRFRIWCGTTRTENWHRRFRAAAVVSGHLHVRRRDERDGVPFFEVSLGYPRDWDAARGLDAYLQQVWPPR